jgi:FlaA1/EpsC-like NDP-sugar epimerase
LGASSDLQLCIADIADEERIGRVFDQYRPQVVFHAAGYKHVPLLETHPREAIKVNAFGTAVLCRVADASGVERFVFISSDKAVAAVNNLGYSKRIGELLMRAYAQGSSTIFCAVRFGNVIGSRGSVVRTFERQIAAGGPVTVTHPEATRFFMSTSEAACLVIEAAARAASGSIFMLDMGQPVPIVSLAEKMIRLRGLRVGADIELVFTGLRPGDKLHEDLICAREDTVPTAHAKIRSVIDRRPVSRPEMEALVRSLFLVSRCADRVRVSEALRAAAHGEPLPPAPCRLGRHACRCAARGGPAAADGRRPAGALLGVALEPVHDPLRAPERGAWAS